MTFYRRDLLSAQSYLLPLRCMFGCAIRCIRCVHSWGSTPVKTVSLWTRWRHSGAVLQDSVPRPRREGSPVDARGHPLTAGSSVDRLTLSRRLLAA